MAKDPAFLFYSSDFLIGTAFFTNDQIGKYIKLLCYQHQLGRLTEEQMVEICKGKDDLILAKFKKDDSGLYYNERLDAESIKRKAFCESRRQSRLGGNKESDAEESPAKKTSSRQKFNSSPDKPRKRPAFYLVQEYRALKWKNDKIKKWLLDNGYTEHEIDEAIGKKY